MSVELDSIEPENAPRSLDGEATGRLAEAMADAVVDRNPSKWVVTGRLHVVIDGEPEEWLLGLKANFEGRVRVAANEYYRGLGSTRVLAALDGEPE